MWPESFSVILFYSSDRKHCMTPRATDQIGQARECLDQERTRTQAEEHAFQQFVSRVDAIEVSKSRFPGWTQRHGSVRSLIGMDSNEEQLSEIEDAYRETVLDTDHYAAEYDDSSIYESIAAELTPEIAQSLKHNDRLTSELQTAILEAAQQTRNGRTRFLDVLDHEAASVTEAHEEIRTIDTAVSELADPPFEAWNSRRLPLLVISFSDSKTTATRWPTNDSSSSTSVLHPRPFISKKASTSTSITRSIGPTPCYQPSPPASAEYSVFVAGSSRHWHRNNLLHHDSLGGAVPRPSEGRSNR
jgi:hypothetical protein